MGWTRGRLIGRGSTATVWTATAPGSDEVFAVKSVELTRSEFLQREQKVLAGLNYPCKNIVPYKGCGISSEDGTLMYNLFLEYAPWGTISDVIRGRGGPLDEWEIKSCVQGMLLGLDFLHSRGIVHCDVKGQNVLVTDHGVKIADFGCARRADDPAAIVAGSPAFMAPEVARGEQQGFPADVWAVGCTVIEMATGRPAWSDIGDPVSALYRIGFSGDVPEFPKSLSESARDFLSKCLRRDPSERWSVEELLDHPFLKDSDSVKEFGPPQENSPTSVLDPGYWSETEETTHDWVPQTSSNPAAGERIRRLCDAATTEIFGETSEWETDGGWITVRSSGEPSDSEELTMWKLSSRPPSPEDSGRGSDSESCSSSSFYEGGERDYSSLICNSITAVKCLEPYDFDINESEIFLDQTLLTFLCFLSTFLVTHFIFSILSILLFLFFFPLKYLFIYI